MSKTPDCCDAAKLDIRWTALRRWKWTTPSWGIDDGVCRDVEVIVTRCPHCGAALPDPK